MNKIYICAAVAAVSISMGAAYAATTVSNVSIKTGTKNLSYTYVIEGEQESAKSIKALFNDFKDVTETKTVERFEVSSKTDEKDPVYLRLRLTLDKALEGLEYSPLDYYSFTIKDADGELIYSTDDAELSEPEAVEKEIPLGVFNTSYTEDVRILNIEYCINSEVERNIDPDYVDDIDVMLVSSLYTSDEEPPIAVQPAVTLKPQYAIETKAPEQASEAVETPVASATETPQASEAPAATEQPKEKKVICGEDIEAGRYVVTGNANVKITTADGDIISETTVTDGADESIKGVKQFITSLENGDVITITPISDDIKAVVNFDRTNSGTKSTTAASSTTNNNTSSKKGSSSAAKTTSSTAKTSAAKTNPKTGDDGYATLSLVSIMCVCAGAVGGLEIVKRKKAAR